MKRCFVIFSKRRFKITAAWSYSHSILKAQLWTTGKIGCKRAHALQCFLGKLVGERLPEKFHTGKEYSALLYLKADNEIFSSGHMFLAL